MKCPVDGAVLQMTSREGVEIDYCPQCRGVWLDRGELDKIVERSGSQSQVQEGRRSSSDYDRREPRRHKRESFLSELFDF